LIENSSVLITGGAGFLGSNLAAQLVAKNEVTIFDNFRRDALTGSRIHGHPNLRVVRGDLLDYPAVRAAVPGHDIIYHAGAIAGIDTVIVRPVETMRVNILGSANVLEAAADVGTAKRVVCFSTSEVFGQTAFRSAESDNTITGRVGEARWTYAVSKVAVEHLAHAYYRERGLPTTCVRPFNIYGPGQVGEGALRTIVLHALKDQPIEIHGDGTQIRAWCYLDDLVRALLLVGVRKEAVGESFNIGNQRAVVTIYGLANTVVRVLGSKSPIQFVRKDYLDVELRVPSTFKAKQLLGFEAEIDLEEGILRTAEWYRNHLPPA